MRQRLAGVNVEVVCVAMTAINSHAVLPASLILSIGNCYGFIPFPFSAKVLIIAFNSIQMELPFQSGG